MRAGRAELLEALQNAGDKIVLSNESGNITTSRFNTYAAIGYLDESGDDEVAFTTLGCPCLPNSPCWPDCEGDG